MEQSPLPPAEQFPPAASAPTAQTTPDKTSRFNFLYLIILLQSLALVAVVGYLVREKMAPPVVVDEEQRAVQESILPQATSSLTLAAALENCTILPDTDMPVIYEHELPITFGPTVQSLYTLKGYAGCYPNPLSNASPIPAEHRSVSLSRIIENDMNESVTIFHAGSKWYDFDESILDKDLSRYEKVTLGGEEFGIRVLAVSSDEVAITLAQMKELPKSQSFVKVIRFHRLQDQQYLDLASQYQGSSEDDEAFLQNITLLMEQDARMLPLADEMNAVLQDVTDK